MGPAGPLQEDVVGLGSLELDQAQIGLFPCDPVFGGGVAEEVLDVGTRAGANGVVAHLEDLIFFVPDHGAGLEHQVAFPGPVGLQQRVLGVLSTYVQASPHLRHLLDQVVVHEEMNSRAHLDCWWSCLQGFGARAGSDEDSGGKH